VACPPGLQAAFHANLLGILAGTSIAIATLAMCTAPAAGSFCDGRSTARAISRSREQRYPPAMRLLCEIDVTNADDASASGISSTSVISPRYHADSDVVAGAISSRSATSKPTERRESPPQHRDGEHREIDERRHALEDRLCAVDRIQHGVERHEHQRGQPLIAQQQPKKEEQEEDEERRPRRVHHVHQQFAGGAAHSEQQFDGREGGSRAVPLISSAIATASAVPTRTSLPTIGSRTRPPSSVPTPRRRKVLVGTAAG
jgi:hypothetical protein